MVYNHSKKNKPQKRFAAVSQVPLNIPLSSTMQTILQDLQANGMKGLVVGGAVRDAVTGHEQAGGPYARAFLERIGVKPSIIAKVVPLVENHLAHMNFANPEAMHKTVKKLALRLYPANVGELKHVIEADHSGRPPLAPGLPANAQRMYDLALQNNVHEKP